MTNEQKQEITSMRQAGCGYSKIAKIIGVSQNSVKSFCRRQKATIVSEKIDLCAQCGKLDIPLHRDSQTDEVEQRDRRI